MRRLLLLDLTVDSVNRLSIGLGQLLEFARLDEKLGLVLGISYSLVSEVRLRCDYGVLSWRDALLTRIEPCVSYAWSAIA